MNNVKISVIMPVYNMEQYLDQSISSWINQTLRDIEIICVDDASSDSSFVVLQKWAKADSRVRIHHFEQNSSAFMARKIGVSMATGKYIMFADADDVIAPEACEELFAEMQTEPVDILHFDTEIENINGLPQSRIDSMAMFVKPYDGTLEGKEVFTGCFEERKYNFSLWNKIYTAEICKKAFSEMRDAVLPKAQDKLTYFAISYFAQSYRGLPDRKYYTYNFGRGGTGFNMLSMKQFERYCTMAWVADETCNFLKSQGTLDEYREIEKANRIQLLNDCMGRWINEVPDSQKAEAFDMMLRYWNTDELIGMLAKKKAYDRYSVAETLKSAKSLYYNKRQVKTIATYYHSIVNGGVQRVLCQLCELWVGMGYNVVVLTDEEPSENDYMLPEVVKRVVLPDCQGAAANNYSERCRAFQRVIADYNVDAVVYHAWVFNLMLWDELSIKLSGAAFIAHCHSIFSFSLLNGWANYSNMLAPFLLADAVVTLSEVDETFWKHYNNNVFCTINPFTDSIEQWKTTSAIDSHNILWLARISPEKKPYDTLRIMQRVLHSVPDAKLHIVGEAKKEGEMEKFTEKVIELELQDSVILHGFHKNVQPFYDKASIFLMTSSYEGYGLTLQESKLAGLPCVMYELPYLTLCRKKLGMIAVKQGDVAAAANAIVDLLQNDDKRIQYGREARKEIEQLFDYDFAGKWNCILNSVTKSHDSTLSESELIMMETLIQHRDAGMRKSGNAMLSKASAENVKLRERVDKYLGWISNLKESNAGLNASIQKYVDWVNNQKNTIDSLKGSIEWRDKKIADQKELLDKKERQLAQMIKDRKAEEARRAAEEARRAAEEAARAAERARSFTGRMSSLINKVAKRLNGKA